MTRVDFYLLPDVEAEAKLRFACRIAHKAALGGSRIHVHTGSEAQSRELDAVMWSYPADHFLPHEVVDADDTLVVKAPVSIGLADPQPAEDEVLVNVADAIPEFFGRFERVVEIVLGPERESGRDRYRHYRDRGYPLFHHELDNWEER